MIGPRPLRLMRSLSGTALAACLCVGLLVSPAAANDFAGLWVGTVSVDSMSRVNRATPDLSFDLALTTDDGRELIPAGAGGWRYRAEENPAHATDSSLEPYQEAAPDAADVRWIWPAYDDSGWDLGAAEFGYGEGDEATPLSYATPTWPRTVYFRREFTPGATGLETLSLQLLCDDGAVVYLNGQEIARVNLPAGQVTYATSPETAVGPSDEGRYQVLEFDLVEQPTLLRQDSASQRNVLAVEIHQHPGELRNPGLSEPELTAAGSSFNLRVLLHSDALAAVKLLKEVYRMYDQGDGEAVPVLLASDSLIPNYSGSGNRVSTAAYDFTDPTVACTGAVTAAGQVTCDFDLAPNHPTNPFLHRYHPDHDNWDARYEAHYPADVGAPEEAFQVERTLKFSFESRYPPGCEGDQCRQYPPPAWGDTQLGGTYTEVLRGLHRDDITVGGTFELERVSSVNALVQ